MTAREWRMVTAMALLLPLCWPTLTLQIRGHLLDAAILRPAGVLGIWAVCRIMRIVQEKGERD